MINAIVYAIVLVMLIATAQKMSPKTIIGFTVFFWVVMLVFGLFTSFGLTMAAGFILFSLTSFTAYFVVKGVVLKGKLSSKEYLVKTSTIIGYIVFWTGVLIKEGFTLNNILVLVIAILFIGLIYKVLSFIAGGFVNTVTSVILGFIPPSTGIVRHEKGTVPPVATRTFRTKKDGKDITHVLIRIDNDATKSKN